MKKRKIKLPFKTIIIVAISLATLYLSIRYLFQFLLTSDYFAIKKIAINNKDVDLSYLKGRNTFSIDLKKLSYNLNARYPDYRAIRVSRYLPDCIVADFVKRKTVAYIRLYRYFAVDREGVLFNPENNYLNQEIPIILGLETKIFGPKPGQKLDVKEMWLALDLIKRFNGTEALRDYKIKTINVSSLFDLSFSIPENVEVKIGQDLNEKLIIFISLLPHIHSELSRIRYIDLRFKEPVIKYKYEK